jgi:hypothetical protein
MIPEPTVTELTRDAGDDLVEVDRLAASAGWRPGVIDRLAEIARCWISRAEHRRNDYAEEAADLERKLDDCREDLRMAEMDSDSFEKQYVKAKDRYKAAEKERDALVGEKAGLRDELARQVAEVERLRADNKLHRQRAEGEYWVWQGDGTDHPESLTCPVLIHAQDLRELLNRKAKE